MTKKFIIFLLVLSLLVVLCVPAFAAPTTEDFDLYSWLIRHASDNAANSPLTKAIEYFSGKDISSSIYKAYGFASDQVCSASSDGLHEAIPSSISIQYESVSGVTGSCVYTAQCKNCGKAFSSSSSRLSSAYSSYLNSLDLTGSGVDSDGFPFYVWQPSLLDISTSYVSVPALCNSSSASPPKIENVVIDQKYSLLSGAIYAYTSEHSIKITCNLKKYCPVNTNFQFTVPITGTYYLLDSSFLQGSGYPYSASGSSVTYDLMSFNIHYKQGTINDLYTAGSTLSLIQPTNVLSFRNYLINYFSTLGVSSSSPMFLPSTSFLYSLPVFKIINPIGGSYDNSINIGNIDNSVINTTNQTIILPNGNSQLYDSYWFTGTTYHVTYTDENGDSQEVVLDFGIDGIVTTLPDGTSTTTSFSGPVIAPSVDGIETNTWLQKIYNAILGIKGSDIDVDVDVDDNATSLLGRLLDFLKSIVVFAGGAITSLLSGFAALAGLFVVNNPETGGHFSIFNEVIALE